MSLARIRRKSSKWTPSMNHVALCFISLLCILLKRTACGFVLQGKKAHRVTTCQFSASLPTPEQDDADDTSSTGSIDNNNMAGPEKSQMYGFISDFLKKENAIQPQDDDTLSAADDPNYFTHLIAVPMGSCHELSIELESVQRAILYHCPVLVHACLVPATTRLPLLYVRQPGGAAQNSPLAGKQATESLHKIVQDVVHKCLYEQSTPAESNQEEEDVNADGVRPLTLTFQSLEVDGAKNDALHTVALSDDPGTVRLQTMVAELQSTIETELGWTTALPPDEHLESNDDDNNPPVFRPRVPFMRLPANFQNYLDPMPDDRNDELLRTSEEGGNGISPIFWATWWEDVFGTARLPEIGIYPRSSSKKGGNGLAEDAFYMPQQVVPLPAGTEAMTQQEAKFESYQEQRMQQAEYDAKLEMGVGGGMEGDVKDSFPSLEQFDPLMTKTRARLESLYQQDILEAGQQEMEQDLQDLADQTNDPARPKIDATLLDDWTQERIKKANAAKGITMYDDEEVDEEDDSESGNDNADEADDSPIKTIDISNGNEDTKGQEDLDDWTRQRIRQAVESRDAVQAKEKLAQKKAKVDILDNPIFQQYKDGTLVPESDKVQESTQKEMEPFPSREQFVGFWHVMSSPTGFDPQGQGDDSKSENLVLRVDGTTAGGPILDPETQQKAAGGTWKVTPNDDDGESAQLRIRLVIPPKKERILVMEGKAEKRALMSPRNNLPPMASGTFGIPELEEKLNRANQEADQELEDLMQEKISCSGEVWVEDAITRKNKIEIGEFSLVKLDTPRDPSQYTITIPRPIRTQD